MKQIKIENYTNVPINVSVTEFDDEFRVIIEDAKREIKPIILDDNPLSIACYMEEHPEIDFDTKFVKEKSKVSGGKDEQ